MNERKNERKEGGETNGQRRQKNEGNPGKV